MAYKLPELPYTYDALEPHISAQTLQYHHDKHHAKYVNTYNELVQGTQMDNQPIEDVIRSAYNNPEMTKLHNNAAQAWNHTFYWNCMSLGQSSPSSELAQKIESDLGGMEAFKDAFKQAGTGQFGSGYAWLVLENGKLKIINTPNAVNPIVFNQTPLLTMDVWEHAYYLDYQNSRGSYVEAFLNNLVNWDFVAKQLEQAKQAA